MFRRGTPVYKLKAKYITGREHILFYIGLAIVYLLCVGLVVLYSINIEDKIKLEMKFNSEQSFNAIYLAFNESSEKARAAMKDEKIYAVGLYSASGTLYRGLGEAPQTLPLDRLSKEISSGQNSTLGIYTFNEEEKTIEYFRLSRLNVAFEIGSPYTGSTQDGKTADIPEIVYIKSDGTHYKDSLMNVRISVFFGLVALSILFAVILNVFNSNLRYKKALAKNENLAKVGAAVRTLTHEIKNPLSAITIQTGLLHKLLPEEYSEDLDIIDHEVDRITNLTNRVSEFLKKPQGTPVEIELISFITDISKLFRQEIKVDKYDNCRLYAMFDEDRARSVFENLIKNATESCEGRDPQVVVRIRRKRDKAIIQVMDRGDGISEEARKKLFDPFFTTKIHGSGIGLAISKQFVEAASGSLKVGSRDGGGTVVEVELPCYTKAEETAVQGEDKA